MAAGNVASALAVAMIAVAIVLKTAARLQWRFRLTALTLRTRPSWPVRTRLATRLFQRLQPTFRSALKARTKARIVSHANAAAATVMAATGVNAASAMSSLSKAVQLRSNPSFQSQSSLRSSKNGSRLLLNL